MERASIAILLATYNGGRYLRQQLDSILAQTEQGWRLLVSDDGSSDDTLEILQEYQRQYPDRIILSQHEVPTGSSRENFMYLTRLAGGYDYVMYCDQDDVWLPQKVSLTLREMRRLEGQKPRTPCLVHTDLAVVRADLTLKSESYFYASLLDAGRNTLNRLVIQNIVTGCTMMMNHALWEKAVQPIRGGDMLMHDWWCALWAAAVGRIGFVSLPTILYRQHGDNVVGAKDVRSFRYMATWMNRLSQNAQSLRNTQAQAAAFLATAGDDLTERQKKLLSDYAAIGGTGKWNRWAVLRRHGIWLLGARRKIAEMMLI